LEANILKWIENWYKSNCNGDWEHMYGITIETLDNPGWDLKIELKDTSLENENRDYVLLDKGEDDWYSWSVKDAVFSAAGDPYKLTKLLEIFKHFVEGKS